jgi:TRAP-type transport system small permease protein
VRRYYAFVDAIAWIVTKVLIILMIALVTVVFANIVLRYVGRSIRWSDEMSRLLFVWVAFLGMFVGYSQGAHPSFNQGIKLVNNRNERGGQVMLLLVHALVIVFLLIVLYGGIVYISRAKIQTTAVLRMSVGWMYAAAPVSMGLMLLEAVKKITLLFRIKHVEIIGGGEEIEIGDEGWKL